MTWIMPANLVPIAGALALAVAWLHVRQPTSHGRLFVEILLITLGVIDIAGVLWARLWWFEHRW